MEFKKDVVKQRLYRRTEKVKGPLSDECWMWFGAKQQSGYGIMRFGKKVMRIHRLSWIIHRGIIHPNMEICHHCDNKLCWNPKHLFSGTHQENMKDAFSKNRIPPRSGELHGCHKLTNKKVKKIRKLYKRGLGVVLARKFGVSKSTITMIAARTTWTHI